MKAVMKEMLQVQVVMVWSLLAALMAILALQLDAAFGASRSLLPLKSGLFYGGVQAGMIVHRQPRLATLMDES